jgi:integrase/recombinase XerD
MKTKIEREVERLCELDLTRGYSPGQVQRYRKEARRLAAFLAKRGKDDLREATEDDVIDYLNWLEEDQGLRRTTVTNIFFILRRLFGFLQRGAVLLENPTSNLARKRYPRRMRDWLSEDEVARLLEVPNAATVLGLRDRAAMEVLYSCGLRQGELRALDVDDLDLGEGLVTVKVSKSGVFRRVPLGRVARHWLGRYLDEARPRLLARRELDTPASPAVFLNRSGDRIDAHPLPLALARYAREAGIKKKVTPHVIRHTVAIHLLKYGAATRHIQALLGHKHLISTQVYTRVLPQDLKRVHQRCHPAERRRKK